MAKSQGNGQQQQGTRRAPPKGMQRLGSVANAGWFDMKTIGNVISGTLEGMFKRPDDLREEKESKFYQVKVDEPCQVRMGRGEDATLVTANPGDVVNLNYGPKTKDLEDLIGDVRRGAVYKIWGQIAGEKIKLRGGKTMHDLEIFTEMVTPPKASAEPDLQGGEVSFEEDALV